MGLADALIKMKIRYGSSEAIEVCDRIGKTLATEAIYSSYDLAIKYEPYPKYKEKALEMSGFFKNHIIKYDRGMVAHYGLRNSQLLTIAPTGSLSSMVGCSGGIEAIYANFYERKTESLHGHDEYYKVYTPIVKKYMEEHNLKDDSELPDYFITAQELPYEERINMQSVWQKHIDASISSTINLPNSTTIEQVEDLYMKAWEKGLKGVTIFRDGCKRTGILTTSETNHTETDQEEIQNSTEFNDLPRGYIVVADDHVIGLKRKLMTGCGSLHVVAMFDPETGDLMETYLSKGSTGGCQSNLAAVSRLMSLCARAGVDVYTIADQLHSCMSCPAYVGRTMTKHDTSKGKCCPDAVGFALIDMYKEMQRNIGMEDCTKPVSTQSVEKKQDTHLKEVNKETQSLQPQILSICPVCGEKLRFEGGCMSCPSCGWSKCD